MNFGDIAHQRLVNQQIARPAFTKPCEVVQWLGAVQAQDYLGALWAVGLVAYRDRSAALDANHAKQVMPGSNGIFYPIVVIDGRVAGIWKRAFKSDKVVLTFNSFRSWSETETRAIEAAAERYGAFVGKTVVMGG